jgi:soluble lytic murein transglycosylase
VTDASLHDALEVLLYPAPWSATLAEQSSRHRLSHALVLGLVRQESAFDVRADSRAGARGLMQLMPQVGRRLAPRIGQAGFHPDDLYDPQVNVALGCQLLEDELRAAGGKVPQALAAYTAGSDLATRWYSRLRPHDPPEMYLDLVEYQETRTYLQQVLGNAEVYRRIYALQ